MNLDHKGVVYSLLTAFAMVGLFALMACNPPDENNRPIKAGDVVVSKLGVRAVVVDRSLLYGDMWIVRTEAGLEQIWAAAEVKYREAIQ